MASFAVDFGKNDRLLVEIEMPFVVNFGNVAILEFNQCTDNGCTMLWIHLFAFRTLVFLQRLPKIGCVDKDYLIFSFCRFIFVENPQIGDDARIEELNSDEPLFTSTTIPLSSCRCQALCCKKSNCPSLTVGRNENCPVWSFRISFS